MRERLALRNAKEEEIGIRTYLHGRTDYAKTLNLRNRVGDLDLPESRKRRTSSREEEEEEDAQK